MRGCWALIQIREGDPADDARTLMKLFLLVSMFSLTAATPPVWSQATPGGDWSADVRAYAERLTDAGRVPGLGVAVVVGDRIAFSEGFGLADRSTGVPVDEGTRFYIASSSKALTATAVVSLAEQGRIDLTAPVTDYLPGLEFGEGVEANDITIHDLLSMTEGLDDSLPVIFRTAYSGEFTPEQLIALLSIAGAAEQGSAFDYSNLPYNILGLVLDAVHDEQLTAGGWKPAVRRSVLEPLGMHETTSMVNSVEADRIAMPHALAPSGEFDRIRLAKDDTNMHAGGGHLTSARSLVRFLAAHIGGGSLEGRQVFPPSVIENTHREHATQDRSYGDFERDGWGYGWDRALWRGERILQRFGGFAGFYSHMSFMPERGIGVVALSNGVSGFPAADLIALYIYDRLLGRENLDAEYDAQFEEITAIHRDRAQRFEQARADRAERLEPLPNPLPAYAGTYYNEALGTMKWQVVAGGLELTMGAIRSRAEIFSASDNLLRITPTGGGTVVRFEFVDGEDRASRVIWNDAVFTRRSSGVP